MERQINSPQKPLCLRKVEATMCIEKAINSAASNNCLSFCDLEDILYRCYAECRRLADGERRKADFEYFRQMEKFKEQKEINEKEVTDDGRNLDSQFDA